MTKKEVVAFAKAVAEHLDGFTVSAPDGIPGAWLTDREGRTIRFGGWWDPGRKIEIRGHYGDLARFLDEHEPHIWVSIDRNPRHVASDIQRHFLPDFVAYWDKLVLRKRDHDAYNAHVAVKARSLADLMPGALLDVDEDNNSFAINLPITDACYGKVKVYEDSVEFRIGGVPHDVAAWMLEVLAKAMEEHIAKRPS